MKFLKEIPRSLWIFLIGIHTFYFLITFFFGTIYTVDSGGYLHQAHNLWNYGSWYAEDWYAPVRIDYFSFRPPLYACFLLLCKSIFSSDYFILIVQNFFSIANIILIYRIYLHLGFEKKFSVRVLMIVFALYPAQFIHTNLVMTEIIFQSLLLLIFYYTLIFPQQISFKSTLRLALLLSVALLTKPVIILFSAFVALVVLFYTWREKRLLIILPFVFIPITFHLICLQNQHSVGYYHFSSVKPIFHLKYNAKYTLVSHFGEEYADSAISAEMTLIDAKPDYASRYETMQQTGTDIIMQHPFDYAKIYTKGLIPFFIDPGRYDLFHLFGVDDSQFNGLYHEFNVHGISALKTFAANAPIGIVLFLILNLCWNLLVACCFVWFLFYRKSPLLLRILIFVFVVYIAVATGVLGLSRYRVPVYPMLSITVLFAFSRFSFFKKHADASI